MKNLSIVTFIALSCIAMLANGQEWELPRTPDGKPDLQGIWTNASQTPLQ